ncbi:transposon Ty3-I Gag-Pol polyprotein [Trichonephila clavipes]|nr:transposon Ty3-I Gag-Pol polyprotein [Trichonephila clavipes]
MDGSQISCAALRALALNSREQHIREQREDPELGHIYRYLENPDDGSVNATVCEDWSQDFKIIDGLLFYAKYSTTLGELRVYIPRSLREAIMQEFHDRPLAGHLGKRKTYLKLRDICYFPYMRKYIFEYVSTCDRCQKFNYKNALPTGRLIPIVSNYPNEIVTLHLLGPFPASRLERYRFSLVITDHFIKWSKRATVNIDQVRVYRPRQFDTISSDSHVETLYEGLRSSNGSSRSHPGKFKGSGKTSNEESKGRKSNKGNAGWEDPRLKRKGSVEWRPVRSKQVTAVRPCPHYPRSRVKQPEGIPEDRRSIEIDSIPQNNIRRRSLSMEALDGDPVDRSE